MTHGSLFSGVGGFDLAAQWMGWDNIFHCEKNVFCLQALKYYWPNAQTHYDIKETDFTVYRGKINVLSGGFPCQPYSTSGHRRGKADDRHLWPEMRRAYREIQPDWIVPENVLGLISWNRGMVFEEVQAEMEADGYQVLSFVLPAAGINAPHRRNRVFFVARRITSDTHSLNRGAGSWPEKRKEVNNGSKSIIANTHGLPGEHEPGKIGSEERAIEGIENKRQRNGTITQRAGEERLIAYTDSDGGLQRERWIQTSYTDQNDQKNAFTYPQAYRVERVRAIGIQGSPTPAKTRVPGRDDAGIGWRDFPTQSPVCRGNDGIPSKLVGITVSKHRNESISGYGNAVVPMLAMQIFRAIEQYEKIKPITTL